MADKDFTGLETLNTARFRTNKAAFDFATALDQSNEKLIGIQEQNKAKKTMLMEQADEIARESDRLAVQHAEAMADPFNDLKAIFTDTPSIADLNAKQNYQQARMNELQRQNQTAVYEYQFQLGQVQQNLSALEKRREFGRQDTAAINAQNTAAATKMQLSAMQRQDVLNSMGYQDLIEARGKVTSGERTDIRDYELEEKIRWWEGASKRAAGKSALDAKKEYYGLIPSDQLNSAVRTGKGLTMQTQDGMLSFTPEELVHAQNVQNKNRVEFAKNARNTAINVRDAQEQREDFSDATMRWARTSGIDIFKEVPDPANPARKMHVLDYKKLPNTTPEQLAELRRLDENIAEAENRILERPDTEFGLEGNKPSSMRSLQLTEEVNQMMIQRQTLLNEMQKGLVTEAQARYSEDETKNTVEQFILSARVTPSANSRVALTEVLANDMSIASGHSPTPPGWNEAALSIQNALLDGFDEATSVAGIDQIIRAFDDDATEEERRLSLGAIRAGTDKKKAINVEMEALRVTVDDNGRQVNKHQKILFRQWNNQTLNMGLQSLLSRHVDEPATQKAILSVMEGDRGMSQKYLVDPAGAKKLLYDLSTASSVMHKQGSLPEDKNLATELINTLRSPQFLNGERVRGMTTPSDHTSALIAAELFNNRQHAAFTSTFEARIRALHFEDVDAARAEGLADDIAKQKYGHTGRPITDDQYYESLQQAYHFIKKDNETKLKNRLEQSRGK